MRVMVAAASALCLVACASPHASREVPPDFGVSVTALHEGAGAPAWYVVGADNALRVSVSPRTPNTPVPPVVRVLSSAEVEGVRQRTEGIVQDGHATRIADERATLPRSPSLRFGAVVIARTSGGATRTCLVPAPADAGDAGAWDAACALVAHLQTLSEASDPTPP